MRERGGSGNGSVVLESDSRIYPICWSGAVQGDPRPGTHFVAVQGVLGRARGQRYGVRLTASITLTVQVFTIPVEKDSVLNSGSAQFKKKCPINKSNNTEDVLFREGLPSTLVLRGGGLGNVDGLLERPLEVDGAFLDHLPYVLDPVLLVLDAGGLGKA